VRAVLEADTEDRDLADYRLRGSEEKNQLIVEERLTSRCPER
jgi:hypothetical protein